MLVVRLREQTHRWMLLLTIVLGGYSAPLALGQTPSPDPAAGHAGHHPGATDQGAGQAIGAPAQVQNVPVPPAIPMDVPSGAVSMPAGAPVPPAATGMAGMMDEMMGFRPPRQFYPSLMDVPVMSPEVRSAIEQAARTRLGAGLQALEQYHIDLRTAMGANNVKNMQTVASRMRGSVSQIESGTTALLALREGMAPQQIALIWFKGQLNLPTQLAAPGSDDEHSGLFGVSWLHLGGMAALGTVAATMLVFYFAHMRRAAALARRLRGTQGAPDQTGRTTPPAVGAGKISHAALPERSIPPVSATPQTSGDAPRQTWTGALRIAAIFRETPTVKTFRLMEPDGGAMPFTFLPGQFLTFSAENDGRRVRRSYTIASSPTQHDYVEITVKREEQGIESRYLHDQVSIGDLLEVSGPSGVFTFTGNESDSIVLIAGGVGITPMMCIIRYLTDRAYRGDIFFLYGARTTQDLIFREELEFLQRRHVNLHFVATLSDAEGDPWTGAKGFISKEFIARLVPDIARRRVHVCGPPPLMETVKKELLDLGVAKEKIKTEAFGPALGAAVSLSAANPGDVPAMTHARDVTPAPLSAAAPTVPSTQSTVQFSKSGRSGVLAPNQSVLEAAEAIGVAIDFSCRVGICGICVVPLISGTVTMEVEEGLPDDQKAKGIILACQAKSSDNLVIDA